MASCGCFYTYSIMTTKCGKADTALPSKLLIKLDEHAEILRKEEQGI